jgi:3-phenylpropionate/cinnamic acid dioxygenase small subunit
VTFEGVEGERRGAATLTKLYTATTRRYDDGTPKTKHVTTNVAILVDGDQASAKSYYTVLQAVPGALALQPIIAGRYRDRFERVEGAWRFSARHVVVDLMGDLSAHLLMELDA